METIPESPEKTYRPAKRKEPKTGVVPKIKTVGVTEDAFTQVEKYSKKLKMSKTKYASAAIAYFAESGLDPTKERPQGLAEIGLKVRQEARAIRVQNMDIGNRLISILRGWEKSLYGFLQQQQGGTLNYLEQIENNVLKQLVAHETHLFAPMIELLVRNNVETYLGRVISERIGLHVRGKDQTQWAAINKARNDKRDQQIVLQLREFIKTNNVPVPTLAPKPQVLAAPAKAPSAPPAGTPGTGAAPK